MLLARLCDRCGTGRLRSLYVVLPLLAFVIATAAAAQGDAQPDLPIIEADPVTVTSTRSERSVLDVPGNVTVIDREQIERSGADSITDLLRREAGVFVTNTTGHPEGAALELRGFNNGGGNGCSTLILIDGRRANEPNTGCVDWSFVGLENVERIEIVRGPVSAAWGSGAIGGVIHIQTRRATEGKLRASVRGHAGTYSNEGVSAHVSGSTERIRASAFHETTETDSFRDRADFRRETTEASLGFDVSEALSVDLTGGLSSTRRQRPGAIDLTVIPERRLQDGAGDNASTERQRFLQASVRWNPIESVEIRLLPYHRQSKGSGAITSPFFTFESGTELDTTGLDGQLSWQGELAGRPVHLLVGGEVRQDDIDNESAFNGFPASDEARRKLWAGFAQVEIQATDSVFVQLGARRDDSDLRGTDGFTLSEIEQSAWSPRAAVTWRINETGSLYASFSRGVRFPNLNESFGFFGFVPGLRPEKSKSYEIGGKWRGERIEASVALYHMNVSDEIFFDPQLGFFGTNDNIDRVRHRGIELSGRAPLTDWLSAYGSYTFDDVKIRRDEVLVTGLRLPITPKHRGTLGLEATLPHGFEAGVNANYVGSRTVANSLDSATGQLGKFASYDARVGWSGELREGVTLQIDAVGHNLTDREYSEFAGLSLFGGFVGSFPAPDRHYTVSARITIER